MPIFSKSSSLNIVLFKLNSYCFKQKKPFAFNFILKWNCIAIVFECFWIAQGYSTIQRGGAVEIVTICHKRNCSQASATQHLCSVLLFVTVLHQGTRQRLQFASTFFVVVEGRNKIPTHRKVKCMPIQCPDSLRSKSCLQGYRKCH